MNDPLSIDHFRNAWLSGQAAQCPICGRQHESFLPNAYCETCVGKRLESETSQELQRHRSELKDRWNRLCPPALRDTDIQHPSISRKAVEAAKNFDVEGSRGLVLGGRLRTGKTRVAYLIAKKAVFRHGFRPKIVTGPEFSQVAIAYRKGEEPAQSLDGSRLPTMSSLHRAKLLIIDDLGKEKPTENVSSQLWALIDHRLKHELRMVLTTNYDFNSPEGLASRLGESGPEIVARLREFCDVVQTS